MTAEVTINEYLGEQAILTLRNGASTFRALAPPLTSASPGETLTLYYRPSDVMVFDAESEDLITSE